MDNQTQTLNEYLQSKGVTTDLRRKRAIAEAFGLKMEKGSREEDEQLLQALQFAEMAMQAGVTEQTYRLRYAFDEKADAEFDTLEEAEMIAQAEAEKGISCRIFKDVTISAAVKTIQGK